jgi:hypothetical protein
VTACAATSNAIDGGRVIAIVATELSARAALRALGDRCDRRPRRGPDLEALVGEDIRAHDRRQPCAPVA